MKRLSQVRSLQALIEEIRDCTGRLHGELRNFSFNAEMDAGPNYLPEHFQAEEVVPPNVFREFGARNSLWFLDSRILWTLDAIRERFGKPLIVNDWLWGGGLSMRGFRPPGSVTGSDMSQHRFGRAVDFNIQGIPAGDVRAEIRRHPSDPAFSYITAVEEAVDWVHIDCRTTEQDKILWFNP